jgi:Uma2 family endonuclease
MVGEILSHSTERIDRNQKRLAYQQAGVRHYWLFDPARPVKVEELVLGADGRYQEQARVETPDLWTPAAFPGLTLDLGELEARIYPPGDSDPEERAAA